MILSEKWKFIFIKGQKVAGTSIEIALSAIAGPNDIITPLVPIDEAERQKLGGLGAQNYGPDSTYYNHMPLRDVLKLKPEAADYHRFYCERHPYSKVLSLFNMWINWSEYLKTGQEMRGNLDALRRYISENFSVEFIARAYNYDLYMDDSGRVAGNRIRYENLAVEFPQMLLILGIPRAPPLPHTKTGWTFSPTDAPMFFTAAQIKMINEHFADEFAAGEYEMCR